MRMMIMLGIVLVAMVLISGCTAPERSETDNSPLGDSGAGERSLPVPPVPGGSDLPPFPTDNPIPPEAPQ